MSISTQSPVVAWRKARNMLHSFKPSTNSQLKALQSYLEQQGNNPDLQIVGFGSLIGTATILADAACTLYAAVFKKANTSTSTYNKLTDSATTASDDSSEIVLKQTAAKSEECIILPQGLAFANGIVAAGTTTASGGTSSGANAATGFIILGA